MNMKKELSELYQKQNADISSFVKQQLEIAIKTNSNQVWFSDKEIWLDYSVCESGINSPARLLISLSDVRKILSKECIIFHESPGYGREEDCIFVNLKENFG